MAALESRVLALEQSAALMQTAIDHNRMVASTLEHQQQRLASGLSARLSAIEAENVDIKKALTRIERKLDEIYPQFLNLINLMQVFARTRTGNES